MNKICASMLFSAVIFTGCGPVKLEKLDVVDTNEEAFLVPLEADASNQGHIGGLDAYEKQREAVTTSRVSLQQRQTTTGRMPWSYRWLETQRLVKIDTSPVPSEWNSDNDPLHRYIMVESMDSIGVALGANITCSIARGDGAKFRYFFAGQTLKDVVDTEVHGYFQSRASYKFGQKELAEFNSIMDPIGLEILEEARAYFAPRGITIDFFGWVGGVRFENPVIQSEIDELFVAENDALVALQEQEVAVKNNEILISKAEARRDAALTAYNAREATLLRYNLDIQKMEAEAIMALAEKFDGQLPRLVPAGSGVLFGIDKQYTNVLKDLELPKSEPKQPNPSLESAK